MRYKPNNERRAVILMVVLSLLTLFAIVGISFVLYADAEAASARVARQAETQQRAEVDPQQALAFFLSQLIYDVFDASGYGSALRGHSLARTMYGWNGSQNNIPFGGVGRLHTNGPAGQPNTTWPYLNPYNIDDYQLINYTWFQGDGFARDPEWYTQKPITQPGTASSSGGYYVGSNAPYTYPDFNNLFLAAVRSDGTVIAPSYHRSYTGGPYFGTLDPSNGNWYGGGQSRYMVLRPRPGDHPNFPLPEDAGGDVRNLPWSKGGIDPITGKTFQNDSFWIDAGAPVMTAPDGTKYKMLFAPCILDLDNRLHVGAAGNILGDPNGNTTLGNISHRSNQGWYPTEVNLSTLWGNAPNPNQTDWLNVFLGYPPGVPPTASSPATSPTGYYGKYGSLKGQVPSGTVSPIGSIAHFYGQWDMDGANEQNNRAATGAIFLPGTGTASATIPFPTFPQGYGSGSTAERQYHPAGYSLTTQTNNNIVFRAADMEKLLRPNSLGTTSVDSGSSALVSYLTRLCPNTLDINADNNALQRRNWITTISGDPTKPGVSPWVYDPSNAGSYPTTLPPGPPFPYAVNAGTPMLPPTGGTLAFPTIAQRQANYPAPPAQPSVPNGSDFGIDWRSAIASLGRLDLNQGLQPFPHTNTFGNAMMTTTPNDRFDVGNMNYTPQQIMKQFTSAMQARQSLALSIYNVLVAITGVPPLSNNVTPTAADLAPRRWLAQLAVNIVDYIDDDEISTPFNFFDPNNNGNPAPISGKNAAGNNANVAFQVDAPAGAPNNTAVTSTASTAPANGFFDAGSNTGTPGPPAYPPYYPASGGNPDVPTYWVFGTELPRVVINEVLGEYTLPTNSASPPAAAAGTFNVNLWVELFNPLPAPATVTATATANTGQANGLQQLDQVSVPLYFPAGGANAPAYNPYQLIIANNNITANAPGNTQGLWSSTVGEASNGLNDNVLGTPQQLRYSTPPTGMVPAGVPAICNLDTGGGTIGTVANPAVPTYSIGGPGGGLPGQSFMIVGPSATDVNNDITAAAGVPGTTPILVSPQMTYQVNFNPAPPPGQSQWTIASPPPPGSPAGTPPVTLSINDNTAGVSVLLRRLANPHLPPNPFQANGQLTIPTMPPNPYITVDYATNIPLNGFGMNATPVPVAVSTFATPPIVANNSPAPPAGPGSYGKLQPYTACNDPNAPQYALQTSARIGTVNAALVNHHTLGLQNVPIDTPFTWLVHLDRALISPMELLHVSGFHPHELTQRFVIPSTIPNPAMPQPPNPPTIANPFLVPQPYGAYTVGLPANSSCFQHYVPWFNQLPTQANRLYRFFEFLDTMSSNSASTVVGNGAIAGKININTLWDTEFPIFQALADPSPTPDNPNFTVGNLGPIFYNYNKTASPPATGLLGFRTPNLTPSGTPAPNSGGLSPNDRPFVGMAAGFSPSGDPQYPNGMGINHTLLTDGQPDANANPTNNRVLQLPTAVPMGGSPQMVQHPYLQNQLLTKIYSRLTTRSNVYAVFLTVGFFQVDTNANGTVLTVDGQPFSPPRLGPEIGRAEGRQIRHRMFAIVDRSQLTAYAGPKQVYDPRSDPAVVPYFSLID